MGPGAVFLGLMAYVAVPTAVIFTLVAVYLSFNERTKLTFIAGILILILALMFQAAVLLAWPELRQAQGATLLATTKFLFMPLVALAILIACYRIIKERFFPRKSDLK